MRFFTVYVHGEETWIALGNSVKVYPTEKWREYLKKCKRSGRLYICNDGKVVMLERWDRKAYVGYYGVKDLKKAFEALARAAQLIEVPPELIEGMVHLAFEAT